MHGLHLSKYYMQQLAYACLHDLTSLSYDSEDDKLARKLLIMKKIVKSMCIAMF